MSELSAGRTSRHVHLDPLSGLAGDMFAAAALDADLVDRAGLRHVLGGLGLGAVRVESERVRRGAFSALHCSFGGWDPVHDRTHRHLTEIFELLEAADLEAAVRDRARRTFRLLGRAEARVHGVDPEEVHFHEVGAVDSILDVVAASWIVDQTGGSWSVGPVSIGTGTTDTDHGAVPLPVPATAELLEGFAVASRSVEAELVTPTGAVILRMLREEDRLVDRPDGIHRAVGYGAGSRELDAWPNVCRMIEFETARDSEAIPRETVIRLACEVDDLTPELAAHLSERLLEAGALDVVREPLTMKKGRVGLRVSLLCRPEDEDELVEVLFAESTTLGVRRRSVQRYALDRESAQVGTPYGPVEVKLGYRGEELVQSAPEYESCRAVAERRDVSVRAVYRAALAALESTY